MLVYILIILCLSLTGVAALQMMYMLYLDRLDNERKKRLHDLELRCKELTHQLADAERQIEEQNKRLDVYCDADGEEAWADLIDDR